MRVVKYLIPLLIVTVLVVWRFHGEKGANGATVHPRRQDVIEAVYATGAVEPVVHASIAPQQTARFVDVLVKDGGGVSKGQMIAKADTAAEEAVLDEYTSRLLQMKNEYERNRDLLQKGFISEKSFDAATANYREVESRIDNQKQLISRLSLFSPIDGTILRRDLEPGEVKTPADTVFQIGQTAALRVVADVDEEDVLKVLPGQAALIKADGLEGRIVEGTVADITPGGDPVTKNFRVYITLPAETPLLVGMTVEVNVVVRKKEKALVVPFDAVKDGAVWVVTGKEARRTPVVTGLADGRTIEVVSGLLGGETILSVAP